MDENLVKVLNKSILLFNRYGIRSISMDDICRNMGISKKTLYRFVHSKSDLVEQMLDYQFSLVYDLFQNVLKDKLNAIDTLLVFSKHLGKLLKENKTNPSLEYDLRKYYPAIYHTHSERRDKLMIKYIKENIRQGIGEGLYRSDLEPELVANLYIKKLEDILDPDFFPEGKFSFRKVFNMMFENHIRGIANEEGIKYFEIKLQSKCR